MTDQPRRHPILDLANDPDVQARFRAAAEERLAQARRTGIPIVYWSRKRGGIVYDYGDGRVVPVTPETDAEVERLMRRARRAHSGRGNDG